MAFSHMQEMSLFRRLAAAIGDSLEDVCNMQEKERQELITVLGLVMSEDEENDEYVYSYLVDTPGIEGRQYRTRTVTSREKNNTTMEMSASQDLLSDSGLGDDEGGASGEKKVLEILGGIINEIVENFTTAGEKDTLDNNTYTGDKGTAEGDKTTGEIDTKNNDNTDNSSGFVVVKQQSDCSTSIRDTVEEEDSHYTTHTKTKFVNKLSLKRKGRNFGSSKNTVKTETTRLTNCYIQLNSRDQIKPIAPPSNPNLVLQKLCSGLVLPSSSNTHTNTNMVSSLSLPAPYLFARLLSCHPLPVQAVLGRQDLPLFHGEVPKHERGTAKKYREELDKVYENIYEIQSKGLVHSGTGAGEIKWIALDTDEGKKKLPETKVWLGVPETVMRTRRSSAAAVIARPDFVTGDWFDNSEDEVQGTQASGGEKDEDWQPKKVSKGGGGESDFTGMRGGKRKLFSQNNDYMDESAESEREEENHGEEARRRKYSRTKKGLLCTVEKLRKEGSLLDLRGGMATPEQG